MSLSVFFLKKRQKVLGPYLAFLKDNGTDPEMMFLDYVAHLKKLLVTP